MTVQAYTKHNSINNWKKKDNKCHRMKIEKKIILVLTLTYLYLDFLSINVS